MEHAELVFRCIEPVSLINHDRFMVIYRLLQRCRSVEGDIAEVGVYKGGTSLGMSFIAPEKKLHLFDSFEGLYEPSCAEHHKKGDFSDTSIDHVRDIFGKGHDIAAHEGWFPDSVNPELRDLKFCFVHVDGAFYETTLSAIEFFFPRLAPAGVMVFDDWEWPACPGVKRALLEGQQRLDFDICIQTQNQVYVRKPARQGGV